MAKDAPLHGKEAGTYAKVKSDSEANMAALTNAPAALESGMAGSFIQTPLGKRLQNYAAEKEDLPDRSRKKLISFLSGSSSGIYTPQSEQITGNLKQLSHEMSKHYKGATSEENSAISSYEDLMSAKIHSH